MKTENIMTNMIMRKWLDCAFYAVMAMAQAYAFFLMWRDARC